MLDGVGNIPAFPWTHTHTASIDTAWMSCERPPGDTSEICSLTWSKGLAVVPVAAAPRTLLALRAWALHLHAKRSGAQRSSFFPFHCCSNYSSSMECCTTSQPGDDGAKLQVYLTHRPRHMIRARARCFVLQPRWVRLGIPICTRNICCSPCGAHALHVSIFTSRGNARQHINMGPGSW